MKINTILFYSLVSITLLCTCVEPFTFEGLDEDNGVVIDGYITNIAKQHKIVVSNTVGFDNQKNPEINNARVSIVDNNGNEELLTFDSVEGAYLTSTTFKAKTNFWYTLNVELSDGTKIHSTSESLPIGKDINDVDFKERSKPYVDDNGDLKTKDVVEILLSIDKSVDNDAYYKWNLLPSWVVKATLLPDSSIRKTCYVTGIPAYDINIWFDNSEISGSAKEVNIAELDFDRKMEHDFRVEVNQLVIGEKAYVFWDKIKRQAEMQGGLFDPIPSSIIGNVALDDEEPVLGYFGVYTESSKVVHFSQHDLKYSIAAPTICTDPPIAGPPPVCYDCFDYTNGTFITNQLPNNW